MTKTKGADDMSYDELDDPQGGASFLLGFIAGTLLGAGLALMYAPRTGVEMRKEVADRAQKFGKRAADEYGAASEKVAHLSERGLDAYQTAATKAREFARRGHEAADDAVESVEAGVAAAKSGLRDAREPRG